MDQQQQVQSIEEFAIIGELTLIRVAHDASKQMSDQFTKLVYDLSAYAIEHNIDDTNEFKLLRNKYVVLKKENDNHIVQLEKKHANLVNRLKNREDMKQEDINQNNNIKQEGNAKDFLNNIQNMKEEDNVRPAKVLLKDGVRHLRIDELESTDI